VASGEDNLLTCAECGATIYPEHLEQHKAEKIGGRLLCKHCLADARAVTAGAVPAAAAPVAAAEGDPEPIQRVSADDVPAERAAPAIKQFGGGGSTFARTGGAARDYRRPLLADPALATRCRTFHAKLNDASLAHLNDQINDWIDGRDDVVIKFATSVIGVMEGKHADPHLIVTIFY